ncbi:hypothetical protein LEP1GSC121_4065 [Leptospira borgpetersenii serovar Castellonis str. 200801910]|uniref:Uncharacterized protein n=1 Tax=Leptospira borgpetersenii serovar Ballum TaxID=280505 RepID=A0A0S2IS14_LEPBO|nr:hypothetical protein LBBP_01820 [Leptospira borgpetersenii serovar Ballum]EKR01880.1 hypothetical protein LEP1GSC121_4065 [Leptospira borgpetersenii serovar Castellonis str. 200801910]
MKTLRKWNKKKISKSINSKSPSQNLKKNIFKRSGKFFKNVRVPTETVALAVFSRHLKL